MDNESTGTGGVSFLDDDAAMIVSEKMGLPKMSMTELSHYMIKEMLDAGMSLEQIRDRTKREMDDLCQL